MSRNTHDVQLDHHGVLDAAQIAGGTATSGYAPLSNGDGTSTWGAVSGGGGTPDLITGDDSTFLTSNGAWANSGGTLTWDSTLPWAINVGGSLKLVTTASTQYAYLPVSGTFSTGKSYAAAIAVMVEEDVDCRFQIEFGLVGTDSQVIDTSSLQAGAAMNGGRWAVFVVNWSPTADRTGVTIRLTRYASSGTITYHVGRAQAIEMDPQAGAAGSFLSMGYPNVGTTPQSGYGLAVTSTNAGVRISHGGQTDGGVLLAGEGRVRLQTPTAASAVDVYDPGIVIYSNAGGASGDLVGAGVEIAVGPDAVGLYVQEKDSATVQISDDAGGSYDIELRDQGSTGFTTSDGTYTSRLNLLHHILVGTADPTAGGGVAHPQPAMYLRDNAGTTEIWTTTGTGATAWQKVTIP